MANRIQYDVDFKINQQGLNQLKASLQQLKNTKFSDIMKLDGSTFNQASNKLADIREKAEIVEDALTKAFNPKLGTTNFSVFNQSLKEAGVTLSDIRTSFSQAGEVGQNAFNNLGSQVLKTNNVIKQSHNLLDKMATTLGNSLKWNLASSAINAMSRSVQQAWGYTKSLDTSLNDIRIVTGKSAEEMDRFAVTANNAAQSLGKTTVDYTKAALIYAQQGLNDEEIEARTAITLKTANVTGQSANEVSEQLTAVWNGYKVNADEAELYVDRLAAVAATTASDLEELSTGMSKVASAANLLGVNEEQLAAQLSTIISVTRQAPESVGTALRTVYARISDIKAGISEDEVDLGRYSGKMAELGFNVLDVNGNLRDMGEVMEEIGGDWNNLNREQQISLAQTMAGQRQYSNLLALFDNWGEYEKALNTAQNAAGTLQSQQDTYMQSTEAHLKQLTTALENVYDSILDPESINPLIDSLKDVTNGFASFIDSIGGGGALLRSLGSIGLMVFNEQIGKSLTTTISNFKTTRQQAQGLKDALQGIQTEHARAKAEGDQIGAKQYAAKQKEHENRRFYSQEDLQKIAEYDQKITAARNSTNSAVEALKKYGIEVGEISKGEDRANKTLDIAQKELREYQIAIDNAKKALENLNIAREKAESNQSTNQVQSWNNKNIQAAEMLIANVKTKLADIGMEDLPILDLTIQGRLDSDDIQEIQGFVKKAQQVLESKQQQISERAGEIKQGKAVAKQNQGYRDALNAQTDTKKRVAEITQAVGAVATLGSAIQNVQNLGSIWKNQNLTDGEKLTQIITNLTSTAAMAIPALTNLTKGISNIFGIGMGPAGAIVAGLGIALELITVLINKSQKVIEANNQIIESSQKAQQTLANQDKAIQAVDELNKKYQQGKIARTELKSSIQDIIGQYGLEETRVEQLITKYDNLTESIKQARRESWQHQEQESTKSRNAALSNLEHSNKGPDVRSTSSAAFSPELGYQDLGNFAQYVNIGPDLKDQPFVDQFQAIVKDVGAKLVLDTETSAVGTLISAADTLGQAKTEIYQISKKVQEYYEKQFGQGNITSVQMDNSELYRWAQSNVENYKKDAEIVIEENEAIKKSQVALKADSIDFSKITNLGQYQEAIAQVKQNIKDIATGDQASELIQNYLKANQKNIYNQFNDASKYLQSMQKQLGATETDDMLDKITDKLNSLDEKQLSALLSLDTSTLTSWEQLETILNAIAEKDFSNVTAMGQAAAADTYNQYSNIKNAVQQGQTISSEDFDKLTPKIQSYFTMMADGTYKMTGDADKFYELVTNKSLEGFQGNLTSMYQKLQDLYSLQTQVYGEDYDWSGVKKGEVPTGKNASFDYSALQQSAVSSEGVDSAQVETQLKYLNAIRDTSPELANQVAMWRALNEQGQITPKIAEQIKKKVIDIGDQTKDLPEKAAAAAAEFEQLKKQFQDAIDPLDEDVDPKILQNYTEQLKDMGKEFKGLSDDILQDLAQGFLRFDDAIQDVTEHYDEWMEALDNGSISQQMQAVQGLRDAYGDVLDIDGSVLSDSFVRSAKNAQLLKDAINGDEQAYNDLADAAAQNVLDIIIDDENVQNKFGNIQEAFNNIQNYFDQNPLSMGEVIPPNTGNLEASLTNIANACFAAAGSVEGAQRMMNAAFQGMGAKFTLLPVTDTEVDQEESFGGVEVHPGVERLTGSLPSVSPSPDGGFDIGPNVDISGSFPTFSVTTKPVQKSTTTKNTTVTGVQVDTITGTGGGAPKIKATKANHRHSSGGSGGGKKGGGGGGGGSSKPDTSKVEKKAKFKPKIDRYHDINVQLSKTEKILDRIQKKQDRLFGKQLLNNLNKQQKALDQEIEQLKEKQKLQKQDAKEQRKALQKQGVLFDPNGDIANYMPVLNAAKADVNAAIDVYNEIRKRYNAETNAEKKKAIKEELDAANKDVEKANKAYENLEKALGDYDKIREDIQDTADDIKEAMQQQIQIEIKKFKMSVEIRLDLKEAQIEWNAFLRDMEQHTPGKDKTVVAGKQGLRNIASIVNSGLLENSTTNLNTIMAQIAKMRKGQQSSIYGDNMAQALEDLQTHKKYIMDTLEEINQYSDQLDEAYLDAIDDIAESFDEQIESLDFVGELLQHDLDLLTLLYGNKNYDAMDKYYTDLEKNNLKTIDSYKKQSDFWYEQWQAALEAGDKEAAQKFEANYKEAISNTNQAIEKSVELVQKKFENQINKIFDDMEKKLTGGKGFDYMNLEWDLMKKNADSYLDSINAVYAIQDTERKFNKTISEVTSVKAQKELNKLKDVELKKLKAKDKLTQYDVDRAEKILRLKEAEIALEEAKEAKTTMRLKRDSQGNYTYQYVADTSAIQDASANVSTQINELYNFDLQRYLDNLDTIRTETQKLQEQLKEIDLDEDLTLEQKEQRKDLLTNFYKPWLTNLSEENKQILSNLSQSTGIAVEDLYKHLEGISQEERAKWTQPFKDIETTHNNYKEAIKKNKITGVDVLDVDSIIMAGSQAFEGLNTKETELFIGQFVPQFTGGVQQMINAITGTTDKKGKTTGGWSQVFDEMANKIQSAEKRYKDSVDRIEEKTGQDFDNKLKTGTDETAASFSTLTTNIDKLLKNSKTKLETLQGYRDKLKNIKTQISGIATQALTAATNVNTLEEALKKAAAAQTAYSKTTTKPTKNTTKPTKNTTHPKKKTNSGNNNRGNNGGNRGNSGGNRSNTTPRRTTPRPTTKPTTKPKTRSKISGGGSGGSINKNVVMEFATGGYTGKWSNDNQNGNGRLAVLHQKELVLNQYDTKNLLDAVKIMRQIMSSLNNRFSSSYQNLSESMNIYKSSMNKINQDVEKTLDQNVQITATFPNVNSKLEIEEAFRDLINLASQNAMKASSKVAKNI